MSVFRLRAAAVSGISDPAKQIDMRAGVIRGVSAMQAVEALGHGVMCDQTTLKQVADAINATDGGVKSRFSHPGACEDSTGKMLGRMKDAKVIGDKVVGDLYLSQSARKSPVGNLYDYVMARAQEDPASFGMSVVVSGESVWPLQDGTEVPATSNDEIVARPDNALSDKPTLRVKKLHAVDVVDEPAANRDGMFSGTTADLSEEMFGQLDAFAASSGHTHQKLFQFAMRYFAQRGITTADMSAKERINPMNLAEMKALSVKHPKHAGLIVEHFSEKVTVAEVEALIAGAEKESKFAAITAELEALKAVHSKCDSDHKASLSAKDDQLSKMAAELAAAKKVADLGAGAPKNVGGDPTDELSESDDHEAVWAKKWKEDKELRSQFSNDKSVYLALCKMNHETSAKTGRTTINKIDHANVGKPTISGEEKEA